MAALTWRDVVAPNLGNPQDSINSAAKLLAASTGGLSGALTQFGDQQVLQQLAQYSDAQKLQEAIRSGAMPLNNASSAAIGDVMNRPAALLANATTQQAFDFNAQKNPLELSRQGIANASSQESLDQTRLANIRTNEIDAAKQPKLLNDVAHSIQLASINNPASLLDAARKATGADRTYADQEEARLVQKDFVSRQARGEFASPQQANAFLNNLPADASPATRSTWQQLLQGIHGPAVGPAIIGSITSGEMSGVTGSTPNIGTSKALSPAIAKTVSAASEKFGVPANYMAGMLNMEGGMNGQISPTGATGPGQFVKSTWNNLAKTPEGIAIGMTPITAENFQKENDPRKNSDINIMASALLAKENANYITKAGLPVTPQNLYLAHNVGPGIFEALKTGKPNPEVLDAMQKNGFKEGDTVATWAARQTAKFDAGTPTTVNTVTPAATLLANAVTPSRSLENLTTVSKGLKVASGAVSSQANDGFLTKVADSLSKPHIDESQLLAELIADPAFKGISRSVIIQGINDAKSLTKLANNNAIGDVLRNAMGGGTEFDFTLDSGSWRSRSFDKDKIIALANQASSVKTKVLSAVVDTDARQRELAILDQYTGKATQAKQVLLSLDEQISQGKFIPKNVIDTATANYNTLLERANNAADRVKSLDRISPSDSEAKTNFDAQQAIRDKAAQELLATVRTKQQEARAAAEAIALEKAPPAVKAQAILDKAQKVKETATNASKLLKEAQDKQAKLDEISWLTPETARLVPPKDARVILNDRAKENLLTPLVRRILVNRIESEM